MNPLPCLLAVLAVAVAVGGCATRRAAPCCRPPGAAAEPTPAYSDRSLFQLDSQWTTDRNTALKLGALGGRPLVVAMFFAKCEYACPVLVHDMKKVQAGLPSDMRGRVGFVLVSFDTVRDTPAELSLYRRTHELPDNWSLLRGSADDVLELAALLGVKFKQDARGQFAHSNLLTVLNPAGEIVHQQVGLNQSANETIQQLRQHLTP